MIRLLLISITVAALLVPITCNGDEADAHFAAHFGASYAINMFTYGVAKRAFKMDSTAAFIFSSVATLTLGVLYKLSEPPPGVPGQFQKAMLQNGAGVLGAGATIAVFQF